MTKDDDGRLEDFWEFNLDLGDRFPLEDVYKRQLHDVGDHQVIPLGNG